MIFNQAKDIEYWAAFQGRLIYLYSLNTVSLSVSDADH